MFLYIGRILLYEEKNDYFTPHSFSLLWPHENAGRDWNPSISWFGGINSAGIWSPDHSIVWGTLLPPSGQKDSSVVEKGSHILHVLNKNSSGAKQELSSNTDISNKNERNVWFLCWNVCSFNSPPKYFHFTSQSLSTRGFELGVLGVLSSQPQRSTANLDQASHIPFVFSLAGQPRL